MSLPQQCHVWVFKCWFQVGFELWYVTVFPRTVCSGFKSPVSQGHWKWYRISVVVTQYEGGSCSYDKYCCHIHWNSGTPPLLRDIRPTPRSISLGNVALEVNACLYQITHQESGTSSSFSFTNSFPSKIILSSWHSNQSLDLEAEAQSLATSLFVIWGKFGSVSIY